jgi:predicted secreted protein
VIRRLLLAAALAALALAPAAAVELHTPVLIDRNAGGIVTIPAGQEFFVALRSDESSDYAWTATIGDGKIIAYEGNVRQPAGPTTAGQQVFVFHANRSGTTTINFTYASIVSPAASPRTLQFTIQVQ